LWEKVRCSGCLHILLVFKVSCLSGPNSPGGITQTARKARISTELYDAFLFTFWLYSDICIS
jgi:hypothetical protein